jgi:hypothetical protein
MIQIIFACFSDTMAHEIRTALDSYKKSLQI